MDQYLLHLSGCGRSSCRSRTDHHRASLKQTKNEQISDHIKTPQLLPEHCERDNLIIEEVNSSNPGTVPLIISSLIVDPNEALNNQIMLKH